MSKSVDKSAPLLWLRARGLLGLRRSWLCIVRTSSRCNRFGCLLFPLQWCSARMPYRVHRPPAQLVIWSADLHFVLPQFGDNGIYFGAVDFRYDLIADLEWVLHEPRICELLLTGAEP